VLHADDAFVAEGVDGFEDVLIVDFAGAGLFAPGDVAGLEIADVGVVLADVIDDVAFRDLLVIDVEEQLDVGMVDVGDDLGAVVGHDDEVAGVVDADVERFEHDDHLRLFDEIAGALQSFDAVAGLLGVAERVDGEAAGGGGAFVADHLVDFDGAFDVGEEVGVKAAVDEGAGFPAAAVDDEDAHGEAEALFGLGEGADLFVLELGQAVEFESREALFGEDFELAVQRDVAIAEMGGVTEAIAVGRSGRGGGGEGSGGEEMSALHKGQSIMGFMPEMQIYVKVVVDLPEGEQPQRLGREICRVVKRVYGVREAEVSSIIAPDEK
jgi:hypothetical protein